MWKDFLKARTWGKTRDQDGTFTRVHTLWAPYKEKALVLQLWGKAIGRDDFGRGSLQTMRQGLRPWAIEREEIHHSRFEERTRGVGLKTTL